MVYNSREYIVKDFIVKITDFGLSHMKAPNGEAIVNPNNKSAVPKDLENLGQCINKIKISDLSEQNKETKGMLTSFKRKLRAIGVTTRDLLKDPLFQFFLSNSQESGMEDTPLLTASYTSPAPSAPSKTASKLCKLFFCFHFHSL